MKLNNFLCVLGRGSLPPENDHLRLLNNTEEAGGTRPEDLKPVIQDRRRACIILGREHRYSIRSRHSGPPHGKAFEFEE